ncbi:MAG: DUF2007 domain-containing protein [Ignavibacteriales bacterium]|nr:DUF2007 domain-containing protein [Ignavibacteriales bacterium]
MVCPQCGTEFREGFFVCTDCNTRLVGKLQQPAAEQQTDNSENEPLADEETMSLCQTRDIQLIHAIKSILEGSGIKFFLTGENMVLMHNFAEAVFWVFEKDYNDAAELIKPLLEKTEDEETE